MKTLKSYELDLETVALPSEAFSWTEKTRTMSTEASSLRGGFRLHRIYNDACDVGIAIRSKRTGNIERFIFTHEDKSEGETMGWNFVPVNPACGVKRVLVIND